MVLHQGTTRTVVDSRYYHVVAPCHLTIVSQAEGGLNSFIRMGNLWGPTWLDEIKLSMEARKRVD